MCQVMQFRLYRVTPFHFVDTFLRAGRASTQYWCGFDEDEVEGDISRALASRTMMNMTLYLLELSRSCYQLSQECPPSLLAASSVYLARATLGIRSDKRFADIIYDHIKMGPFWSPTLCYYTSYNPSTMAATIVRIHQLHMGAELLSPVYIKYQKDSRRRVSMKTVCRVEDLGLEEWRDGGRNHDDWSVDSNFVIRA